MLYGNMSTKMSIEKVSNISAFVVCQNEEKQIERCLDSIAWCSEIIIVDSGSVDNTVEICKRYTDKIFHRPWTGYVDQKRFALEKCSQEWILNIDADEVISPELKIEIQELLKNDSVKKLPFNGFQLSRVVFYLNKWWRQGGWYPEYRLRLCRRAVTTWGGDDPHEKALVDGQTANLKGELYHYTYDNLQDQVNRLNRYSTSAARSLFIKGTTTSRIEILIRPVFRFIKFYILKQGFRDGFLGLAIALLESYYVFLKYLKLWEFQSGLSNID